MLDRRSLLVLALAACGGNGHSDTPDGAVASVDAPHAMPDAAPDAPTNLGPFPTQPTVASAGGSVLAAPHVVPIFFANDASQATIEMFLQQLVQDTAYWSALGSEYGVGALTVGASVIATETPPTTDAGLQTIVAAHANGSGGWPANTPNTIYSVYLPDGITLTMQGGTSCTDFAGYHSETQGHVVYSLMPRCTNSMTFPGLEEVTIASSHEFLEAATDPHPFSTPAFNQVDDEHAIWGLAPGGELGDMCETARGSFQPLVGSFMVQRTWSNVSAAAGHDPCVPVLATPYVEAATILPDITVQGTVTPGISIPLNTSKTIEVDLYSDAPTADWTVVAFDGAMKFQNATSPELTFAFDKTTGHNGDKLQLTVTRVANAQELGLSEIMLASQVNGITIGTWFTLVTQ